LHQIKTIKLSKESNTIVSLKQLITFTICLIAVAICMINPMKVTAAENGTDQLSTGSNQRGGELHAFYPSYTVLSDQIKKYIDDLDSLSFAWSRIDAEEPGSLNTVKGKNGNYGFYYPANYLEPIEYAKSKGKTIQLNIYMDRSDCIMLLPYEEQRSAMIKAIMDTLQMDISLGNGIYYDGVVIDFEGLRNTDTDKTQLLYEGELISSHFTQFLKELKSQLAPISKKLYVAVNPGLYYDGYDYTEIIDIADRVILMAHDYEPIQPLQKDQVQQYTGYDALEPVSSMAPVPLVRLALEEMKNAASDVAELSKVWLQITFDSAQWQFDVDSVEDWEKLDGSSLSREGRCTPLYKAIKARIDNTDGNGERITYGYNNELQSPYIQYYNTKDKSWNIILYEDSNSISAKIDLAKYYGFGGISLWSLSNVPDYKDSNSMQYHLDGWTTILADMDKYNELPEESSDYIKFSDKAVEQVIREKLGKENGEISVYDLQSIYRLKLPKDVNSLKDLKYLTNLEYLSSPQLELKDITVLGNLKNLRVLYLQRNQISDISPLKKLTNLEVLSLNGNQVVTISALSSLKKLQKLYLRENKIVSITPLAKLTKLNTLELGMNSITKIDSLKNLKKLRILALDNNKISDVQALKNMSVLENLYLQRNVISSISPLSNMKSLEILSLNGNKITDLKYLTKLILLEKLYLMENKIKNVTPLKGLINLKELYLDGNKISDYSSLKKLYQQLEFSCDFTIQ